MTRLLVKRQERIIMSMSLVSQTPQVCFTRATDARGPNKIPVMKRTIRTFASNVYVGMIHAYNERMSATQQRTVLHESAYLDHYVGDRVWWAYLDSVALSATLEPSSALLQVQSRGFYDAIDSQFRDQNTMASRSIE